MAELKTRSCHMMLLGGMLRTKDKKAQKVWKAGM